MGDLPFRGAAEAEASPAGPRWALPGLLLGTASVAGPCASEGTVPSVFTSLATSGPPPPPSPGTPGRFTVTKLAMLTAEGRAFCGIPDGNRGGTQPPPPLPSLGLHQKQFGQNSSLEFYPCHLAWIFYLESPPRDGLDKTPVKSQPGIPKLNHFFTQTAPDFPNFLICE